MSVIINGKKFDAEYLNSPEDLMKGMMGKDELKGCMVFKMNMGHHKFHMKNCLIPLDIVYVLKNRINKIHNDCQPCDGDCETYYNGIGDHVLEFPAGTAKNFKVGDKVNMYIGSPLNPISK